MADKSICTIPECGKPVRSRGWCEKHYQKWRKRGDPLAGAEYGNKPDVCTIDGCDSPVSTRTWCKKHYHRFQRYGDPQGGANYYKGDHERWLREQLGVETKECILWPFFINPNGYGSAGSRSHSNVHGMMCEMAHGPRPSDTHEVAHSCNVRACVNHHHLRWATRSENMADKTQHGTQLVGERNHQAKLTEDQARAILALKGKCLLREAAAMFGTSISNVSLIWRKRAWAWMEQPSQRT